MPSHPPLLIDLTGVARLADVQRPVASMWRARFTSSGDPFPGVVAEKAGRALFDAMSVAQWLTRTEHGNNPDAVADAAASAEPRGFDVADASHVAAVDALLALRAISGEAVGGSTRDEVRRRAVAADPHDDCMVTESATAEPAWTEWADLLADAAYSPIEASRLLERRHSATRSSSGSSGALISEADALLVALTESLIATPSTTLVMGPGITPALAETLHSRVGEDVELLVPATGAGRGIRRHLLCDGVALPSSLPNAAGTRLVVVRLPSPDVKTTVEKLQAMDELVLAMRDRDRAVVIAPAGVLTNALSRSDELARTDVLRSGRVRAIVKLPAGLITTAPREALALWVFGRETGDIPIGDRFTAVADLTGAELTVATRADLTSDVLAAMGSAREVRAHAFRFTRLVRTTSLLAARGALVSGEAAPAPAPTARSSRDLPALMDQAFIDLGEDAPERAASSEPGQAVPSAYVEELIAARNLRVVSGIRLAPDEASESGLVVVGAEDLDDPARIGERRVDPLVFAARHRSARLTVAGDVVFRTAPTPRAWVDPDGSKIVAHPARVFRIDPADPGGLVPELVAADIERSACGPGSWRRWSLRRVAPRVAKPLRNSLSDVELRRKALARRIEALDTYAELLMAGVASGVVTLSDDVADAPSNPY